jgi:IS30 family transposase
MDYMSGSSTTKQGNDCVFVVVDRFYKMVILVACKKSITAEATAKLFFERFWVHFGIPQTIVSDQGHSISQHILVEPLVTAGHQAHQIHGLPPLDRWPNRGRKLNDCAYPSHV